MNLLIIYHSEQHGNTVKVAEAMASEIGAELKKYNEVDIESLGSYDTVGFGSGIYFSRHHESILDIVEKLPAGILKRAFVFSTSGAGRKSFNDELKSNLALKGVTLIGDFACKGIDTYGPFKVVGGIAKGRPNEKDLARAREFAKNIVRDTE